MPMASGKLFWPVVKGLENWLRQMCLDTQCSNLKGDFKSFVFPHHFGWGYAAMLISLHFEDPKKAGVMGER